MTTSNSRRIMIIVGDQNLLEQMQAKFPSSLFQTVDLESQKTQTVQSTSISTKTKPSRNKTLICVVCGGAAHGINFGVVTCEGCKLFFRRNALKDQTKLVCPLNNTCEIKYHTRRFCISCRLKKCFESGMKRDRLLNSQAKQQQTTFTDSNQISIRPRTSFIDSRFEQSLLTPLDLKRIETIRMAFANRIELAANDDFRNQTSIVARNHLEYLNSHALPVLRLLVFYKQIPEFNQLNAEDKFILTKHNLLATIILYYTISFKKIVDNVLATDDDVPYDRPLELFIYGDENYHRLEEILRPVVEIGMYDNKIIHLALIIFILLSGLSIVEGAPEAILQDGMSVYRAQKFYTELLWKYLAATYGYKEAVRLIVILVTRFVSWQRFYIKMREDVSRHLSERDVNQLSPIMKSLFHL